MNPTSPPRRYRRQWLSIICINSYTNAGSVTWIYPYAQSNRNGTTLVLHSKSTWDQRPKIAELPRDYLTEGLVINLNSQSNIGCCLSRHCLLDWDYVNYYKPTDMQVPLFNTYVACELNINAVVTADSIWLLGFQTYSFVISMQCYLPLFFFTRFVYIFWSLNFTFFQTYDDGV